MSIQTQIARSIILYGIEAIILLLTNPKEMPSILLIIPFVLLFVANYVTAMLVLNVAAGTGANTTVARWRLIRPRVIAVLVSGFPVLLLTLQSIGQLTARDLITSCVIFILAYFYIAKSSSATIANR